MRIRISFPAQVLLGMLLGILAGWYFGGSIVKVKMVGDVWIRLLQMAVVPIIFTGVTCATGSLGGDMKKFGRLGYKILVFYIGTTILAISLGVIFSNLLEPGAGLSAPAQLKSVVGDVKSPSFDQIILNMTPKNPIDAMARMDMFQIVVFSTFFGLALAMVGEKGEKVLSALDVINKASIKIIYMVMPLAPLAVFGLMAWVTGTVGISVLIPLVKYVITIVLALLFQTFVVCGLVVWGFARVSPIQFYRRCVDAIMVAFSTCSSSASLPVVIR